MREVTPEKETRIGWGEEGWTTESLDPKRLARESVLGVLGSHRRAASWGGAGPRWGSLALANLVVLHQELWAHGVCAAGGEKEGL